jgi:hypothetical protein
MHVLDHDGDTLGVDGAKVLVKREKLMLFHTLVSLNQFFSYWWLP